jgi:hypothetical protein
VPEGGPRRRSRGGRKKSGAEPVVVAAAADEREPGDGEGTTKRRRRGGRGRGSGSRRTPSFEAVLDTGDEGYGFWLDGAVRDDPVFAEHWAERRAIVVRIEADQIVIRPADEA